MWMDLFQRGRKVRKKVKTFVYKTDPVHCYIWLKLMKVIDVYPLKFIYTLQCLQNVSFYHG